ncbi:hypothetical protein M0804_004134 [Polistes exclamans]|nr:hypothetical protein M0804_004134 [Polistes exclamans]
MDEDAMWKNFYHKIVEEKETKEKEQKERTDHELRKKGLYKMAHFHKLDEKHPYYAIAAVRMSQKPETKPVTTASIYWKFAAFNFISKRIQEIDGGFFENLGTLLVEKVRAQEEIEGPLPKKKEETGGEDEDSFSEVESIEEPTEALLETDSDRDEKEHAHNFLIDSVGLNLHRVKQMPNGNSNLLRPPVVNDL